MQTSRLPILLFLTAAVLAGGADWPMFRADAARSGYTAEELPGSFTLRWTYRAGHGPVSAWPTRNRLLFDRAYQPIVAGGTLYFGSSADDALYALDAATGEVRWRFVTEAPLRFAPAVWQDRLFLAGDDGWLYCLAAQTGEVLWRRRGGPRDDMLLGNGRMISRWPARGGPVVADGVVYYGAGIWPSEGIFLYALSPDSGKILWKNDASGSIEMDQPHPTARARSGLSAQGYLAACGDALFVPTGRAVPAVLNRPDGTLRFFSLQANQKDGGTDVLAFDRHFVNGGVVYAAANGQSVGRIGLQVAVHPDYLVYAVADKVVGLDRHRLTVERETVDRKGNKQQVTALTSPVWQVDVPVDAEPAPPIPEDLRPPEVRMSSTAWLSPDLTHEASALIVAADRAIVGGRGRVTAVDIPARSVTWSADVEGAACGLAVAGRRLYVSTDRGLLYCFDDSATKTPAIRETRPEPLAEDAGSPYARAAAEILRRVKTTDGYCVDLGCGDGGLTLELARQSDLKIYAVDPDAANVEALRQRLDRAGMYGTRVTMHQRPLSEVPYADYCADLVVSGCSLDEPVGDNVAAAAERLARPAGGVICFGPADSMQVTVRGPLAGSGDWTHQNTSPANTFCSDDRLVHGPLEMLWFRDTDFLMINRHGRAPTALVEDGRMFVEGLNGLRAQSIYNGRVFWEFSVPGILSAYNREHSIGAAWTGGNLCLGPRRVYLHDGRACFVLEAETGQQLARWEPPQQPDGKPGVWGYIACADGILFGSLAREDYLIKCWSDKWDTSDQFTESTRLFAMDADTGRLLWSFSPEHSIRNNAIAMGGGRVYLIDRPPAVMDDIRYVAPPSTPETRRGTAPPESGEQKEPEKPVHPPGRLIALDQKTGQRLWETDEDVFGTLLAYSEEEKAVWMGYQAAHQASRPSEVGNRMALFNAADGRRRWDVEAEYVDRPILNGRTIYAPPGAWDLATGRKLPFALERSYGCGTVIGSANMLLFRSATLGYVDLAASPKTRNYGGIRPGCWVPGVPAGGVFVMPDAASWCTCSYLNQGTVALKAQESK